MRLNLHSNQTRLGRSEKHRIREPCTALIASLVGTLTGFVYAAGEDPRRGDSHTTRPVTVADTICMTKLGDHDYSVWGASPKGRVAHFSPDGKTFIVVIRKGNIQNNTNEYSMLLWHTSDVFNSPPPAPRVLLTMSSSSNRPAIQNLKWLPDSTTVAFVGENPAEHAQLYTFNTKTRALGKLSNSPKSVLAYDLAPDGTYLVYIMDGSRDKLWNEKTRREGVDVST